MTLANGDCKTCEWLDPCHQAVKAGRDVLCVSLRPSPTRKPRAAQKRILAWVHEHGPVGAREIEAGMEANFRLSATLRRMVDGGLLVASPGPGTSLMYAAKETAG